jgi:hypothetical protein
MRPYDEDYISFMEETGAEYIGRCFQWQYFRKRSEFGRFDLFSDLDSRISHCGRIHRQLLADISGAFYNATVLDPVTGGQATKTFYTSSVPFGAQRYDKSSGATFYDGMTFSMTEK